MTEKYKHLITVASTLIEERYAPPVHSVASALQLKSGKIITGVNIDHFSGFVCAETSALSQAINQKEYEFDAIVAVRKDAEGNTVIANMCGKCRQIFHDYAPGITVIVSDHLHPEVKTIDELLPFSFKRQQEKIHAIIEGVKNK